ncbi:hypothetical protein NKG94_31280 [Micromonospora sp. M12]
MNEEAGMTEQALTRVALYTFAQHTNRRVAEFRWQPGQTVSLTVLDPSGARSPRTSTTTACRSARSACRRKRVRNSCAPSCNVSG